MHVSPEMQSAWTELWSAGHLDSLPQDRAAGLLGSLDSAWKNFFSLFHEGARLLDLATGGGEAIRSALALGRQFDIAGVDIADLSAVRSTFQGNRVTLIGHTNLSALPFEDATFDGVASQFGIEYSDVELATREALRVLIPGGRGHFVLHHRGSAITAGVVNNLAAEQAVFAGTEVFQLGKKLFEFIGNSAPGQAIAAGQLEFQRAVAVLQSRLRNERAFAASRNVVVFLSRLAEMPHSFPVAETLHRLDLAEQDVSSRRLRKQAQLHAALDRNGVERLSGCLTTAGAVVDLPRELKYPGGKLMAWSLSFHK